ncbi:MAG: restriction endonuclease subunit S [Ignavibacteria bacterium]|nr:restriction endonuclease subunit S [Ignavibacteria bacterium]
METLKEITLKLPWLNNLPGDWEIERGKRLFKKVQRSFDDKSETVTAFRDGQVTLRKNRRLEGFTESIKEFGYQGVNKGDLVIHSMDGFAGAIGVSDSDGKCSPVYNVCLPISNANQYYYSFLLRYLAHQKYIMSLAKGIRERSTDFRFEDFGNLILPVPPRKEQDAIVKFLDEKIADIDKYISAKQKLIDLLNEQKAAIINQAVTKGIDPNVKMKDSGVEWLGDVPKHWEIKPLKHWVYMNQEKLSEDIDPNYEFEYLDIGNVQTGKIVGEIEKFKFENAPSRARRIVRNGDTIISTVRTYLKAVLYIDKYSEKYIVSTGFAVLTPRKIISPYFLYLAVQNNPFISMVTAKSVGASYPAINPTTLGTLKLAAPYDVTEQLKIIKFINAEFIPIEKNIDSIQSQINLMESYKISLIAEAVTGKLKIT